MGAFVPWQDYYLWAGLGILLLNSYHLFRQRTLADKSTLIFNHLLIRGILICVLGIINNYLLAHNQMYAPSLILGITTVLYIVQVLLPWEFLQLIFVRMNLSANKRKLYTKIATATVLFFIAAILLNIPLGFIAYMEVNNYLYHGPYYYFFASAILAWHICNCLFIILKHNKFFNNDAIILIESCIILIIGAFLQYHLHISHTFGFAVALSIMSMQLTMSC